MPTDPEFQWGKMSRGQPYVILATDMLRAIMSLGLGEVEGALLAFIIENTWGRSVKRGRKGEPWPDSIPFNFDLDDTAKLIQVSKSAICNARLRLVRSNIIRNAEGGYMVNKNVHEWTKADAKTPRFDPRKLSFPIAAQRHKQSVESNVIVHVGVNDSDPVIHANVNPEPSSVHANVNGQTSEIHANVNDLTPSVHANVNPPIGTRAGNPTGFNTKLYEVNNKHSAAPPDADLPERRSRTSSRPKQRGLALEVGIDEPFISPPDAPPLPSSVSTEPDHPDLVRMIASLKAKVVEATRSPLMPDGNGEMAEVLAEQCRKWRKQNYPIATIDKFSHAAIANVRPLDQVGLVRYIVRCFERTLTPLPEAPDRPPPIDKYPKVVLTERDREIYGPDGLAWRRGPRS